jgi:hypothetical protein
MPGDAQLQVYSARLSTPIEPHRQDFFWQNEFPDNAAHYQLAHTSYTIRSQDGKVVKQVQNAENEDDPTPALVSLPPGRYDVEAQADQYGLVTVPVVVESGKLTVVNLQRTPNPVVQSVDKNDAVVLGEDTIVGWRGTVASQP